MAAVSPSSRGVRCTWALVTDGGSWAVRAHVRIHPLGAVGQHHRQQRWRLGDEVAEEVDRLPIGRVQVLDHQDDRAQPDEQFDQGAERAVPFGVRIAQRLERAGQRSRQLGEQRAQRTDHR
jgi:hypothetical protein